MEILIYFISIGLNVTGQHYDQQDERLTSQLLNQSGHCPLTGRYFKPCKQQCVRLSWSIFVIWTQYKLLSRKKLIPQWKSFWVYVNNPFNIVSRKNKKTKQIVAGEILYIIQLCFIQTPLQGKELQTYNLQPNRTELYYMYCFWAIRKFMSIFLPFQDLTNQCIMPSFSHIKRRVWSQATYFLYPDF